MIGVLDLLTRTPWRLEVKLPADKAYFTTTSLWHNQTPLEQPYYTWMNAGFKAAGNLQFVYPGTHDIGHGGEAGPWPIDAKGRDLSFYERNDFGGPKSYHVLGRESDFWGAFWHDDDFGMGRCSPRDEKLGKKIWIWGLSRQGMIWEKLLTDTDGQYVELQSGPLLQPGGRGEHADAVQAPGLPALRHRHLDRVLVPGGGHEGPRGRLPARRPQRGGARGRDRRLLLPARGGERHARGPRRRPGRLRDRRRGEAARDVDEGRARGGPAERLRVRIGHRLEWSGAPEAGALSRPLESPADFDWDSVYGLWLKGKEHLRQRAYGPAREALEACLKKDPHYVPALADLALLRYRAMDYAGRLRPRAPGPRDRHLRPARQLRLRPRRGEARPHGRRAGRLRAGRAVGRAARRRLDGARAARAARRATSSAPPPTPSAASTSTAATSRGTSSSPSPAASAAAKDEAGASVDALLALDPLSPFARFEKALAAGGDAPRAFAAGVRGEMPQETFLELAAWYHGLGRLAETEQVLELAPPTAEVLYWLARVKDERGDPGASAALQKADAASPELVFPFRPESAEVMAWAASKSASWRPRYYQALVHWGAGNVDEARRLFEACGETPDYAPFYAARSLAFEDASRERSMADLERAARLDPAQWRYGRMLADRQLRQGAAARGARDGPRLRRAVPRQLHPRHAAREGAPRERALPGRRGEARPPERHPLRGLDRGPAALPRGPPHARRRGVEEGRHPRRAARGRRGPPLAREPRRGQALPRGRRRASRGLPRRAGPRARAAARRRAAPAEGRRPSRGASGAAPPWCTPWP